MLPMDEQTAPLIVFMDDEISSVQVVRAAVAALREAGFRVQEESLMSAAQEAFFQPDASVAAFVLDVDMSQVRDQEWSATATASSPTGEPQEAGIRVAGFLKALDREVPVIIFSARGGVASWFQAANHHVAAYVHKEEGTARLVEEVRAALARPPLYTGLRPLPAPPRLLLVSQPPCGPTAAELHELARHALPAGWEVVPAGSLQQAVGLLEDVEERWGGVAVVADRFGLHSKTRELLARIAAVAPRPHVTFACRGETAALRSILGLVNLRPFRLIDLAPHDWPDRFRQALQEQIRWFGQAEIPAWDPVSSAALGRHVRLAPPEPSAITLDEAVEPSAEQGTPTAEAQP